MEIKLINVKLLNNAILHINISQIGKEINHVFNTIKNNKECIDAIKTSGDIIEFMHDLKPLKNNYQLHPGLRITLNPSGLSYIEIYCNTMYFDNITLLTYEDEIIKLEDYLNLLAMTQRFLSNGPLSLYQVFEQSEATLILEKFYDKTIDGKQLSSIVMCLQDKF